MTMQRWRSWLVVALVWAVGYVTQPQAVATMRPAGLTAADWQAIQSQLPQGLTAGVLKQQAYLKASDTILGDEFGTSVAVDGDTVVIGAYLEDGNGTGAIGTQSPNAIPNDGAVYVFVRDAQGAWSQQAYLKASNSEKEDWFGSSVAVSGDTIVVGTPYEDSNAKGVNGTQTNNSAIDAGAAYVFVRSGTTWTQQAYLKASNTEADDRFGWSVGLSGDTIVVGTPYEDSNATGVNGTQTNNSAVDAGAAYVFVRNGTTWSQQAYLKASNTKIEDVFGQSVAVSGNTVVVGASLEDSSATGVNGDERSTSASQSGAAYVFVRNGTTWSKQAYLKASNTDAGDLFGSNLAISGDTIVVGTPFEDSNATDVNGTETNNSAMESGAAYVFIRDGNDTWSQQAYLKASNTGLGDFFGKTVAVDGDVVVVGAYSESSNATGVNGDQTNNDANQAGAAYVFVRGGAVWKQQVYLKASNTDANDAFSSSVAVSGDTIVVGASGEDSNATGINGDGTNDDAANAGAAYVFAIPESRIYLPLVIN